jgi:ATP-binding cassette subfamily B protein
LLDEATSALDTESEQAIREALTRLMAGRTVMAIAHRLSTLRQFDRIVVIKEGRVIEDGAPSDLIENGGHFSRLVKKEARLLSVRAA